MPAPTALRPTYPIRTARLDLRPHRPEDLDDLFAFHSKPDVVRYVPWPVRDREQTRIALEAKLDRYELTEPGQWLILAIELRSTGGAATAASTTTATTNASTTTTSTNASTVIGEVLLKWESRDDAQGELGFAMNDDYHGRGLAREAAEAMLALGFDDFGLHRIRAVCIAENDASIRLLERLGMRREAHLRENVRFKGEWRDQLVFALLDEEWRAGASSPHVDSSEEA